MGDSMSVTLKSSSGGSVTLLEPATASDFTVTMPAADGVTMVSGNMPAFSAYGNADQTIATETFTKVQYNIELFDTASAYDNATNYRFTPLVAGYYSVYAFFDWANTASTNARSIYIYKNGSAYRRSQQQTAATSSITATNVSAILYLNGSTDYIEIYSYQSTGGNLTIANSNGQIYNGFEACLIRSA